MRKTHVRTSSALLGAIGATAAAAAALPNVSPVWATTSAPALTTCEPPLPAGGSPAPVELSRTAAPSGVLVLTGPDGGRSYTTLGCRSDGAEVARTTYELHKAPKSNRWLVYVASVSYGTLGVFVDYDIPQTERQFDRAVKRDKARHTLRLPKINGEVFVTKEQRTPLSVLAKKVNGKRPTAEQRIASAETVLNAGNPLDDQR